MYKQNSNKITKTKTNELTTKRKRIVLDFVQREEIIQKLKKGYTPQKLAVEYNVGLSTISDIKAKGNDKLLKHRQENPYSPIRKVFKEATFKELDEALKIWFYQERAKNNIINYAILQEKAKQFFGLIYPSPLTENHSKFQASVGYIQRFVQRNAIKLKEIHGEKLSADTTDIETFLQELHQTIVEHQISYEAIYNADEAGCYFRGLPHTTLTTPAEKEISGYKVSKNRITIMPCVNATGNHKLPLLVIGKSANPQCFKHLNKNNLPICYKNSKNAWMTQLIFEEWFHEQFVPAVEQNLRSKSLPPKALLIVDN